MQPTILFWFILTALLASNLFGQANGKLQIHFIDVGQGYSALLISPHGETVLFDSGVARQCDKPVSYVVGLGVSKLE